MTEVDWLKRVASIRQWSRWGTRAPHKPLLLLYAIGRLMRFGRSRVSFREAEEPLKMLLRTFGPPGTGATPQYPFCRLAKDGLWRVEMTDGSPVLNDRPADLRRSAVGSLTPEFEMALADPVLRARIVRYLLSEHFPARVHNRLLAAVQLPHPDAKPNR
jgi:putative restriction endonuclease